MLRRDLTLGLAGSVGGGLFGARAATFDGPGSARLQPTAAELAAGVNPSDLSFMPGDVRRYGAIGDWNGSLGSDDTAALQRAIRCNASIYLPPGRFKTSSTLLIPQAVQILGSGGDACSIDPQGCDGLTFSKSDGLGPTLLADFALRGNGTKGSVGIRCPGSAEAADQVNGLRIENVRIHHFQTAMSVRTLWHSNICGCVMNNVQNGIAILGQSTVITIEGCQLVCVKGAAGTTGVSIEAAPDYNPGRRTTLRPESILIRNNLIYGFETGVDIGNVLDARVVQNVLDDCGSRGIRLVNCDGTCTISDNWIEVGPGDALTGIDLVPVGRPPSNIRNIRDNYLVALDAGPGSIGISIGGQQDNSKIVGNSMSGFSLADIRMTGAANCSVTDNRCGSKSAEHSIANQSSGSGVTVIDRNVVMSTIYVHPTANGGVFRIGPNHGPFSTYLEGRLVMAGGATSAHVAFADLPGKPAPFGTTTQGIEPRLLLFPPTINLGAMWGTVTDTHVTVACERAPAVDLAIHFQCLGTPVFLSQRNATS
jgi:hypothetical protein